MEYLSVLPIVIPFIGGLVYFFLGNKDKLNKILSIVLSCLTLAASLFLISLNGSSLTFFKITEEINIAYFVDKANIFASSIFSFIFVTLSVFISLNEKYKISNNYYLSLFFVLGSISSLCLSFNTITMYLSYFILMISTFPVLIFNREEKDIKNALNYLFFSLVGLIFTLFTIIFLMKNTYLNGQFVLGGDLLAIKDVESVIILFSLLFTSSLGGLAPFFYNFLKIHQESDSLPGTIFSSIISKTSLYLTFRIIYYQVGIDYLKGSYIQYILITLALITTLLGAVNSFRENNIKKKLSSSSLYQHGLLFLSLFLMDENGLNSFILLFVIFSLSNICLFTIYSYLKEYKNIENVDELEGVGKSYPILSAIFIIGVLNITCFPPFGGFSSILNLAIGSIQSISVMNIISLVIVLTSVSFVFAGFTKVLLRAYLPENDNQYPKQKEPLKLIIVLGVISLLIILQGMFTGMINNEFHQYYGGIF